MLIDHNGINRGSQAQVKRSKAQHSRERHNNQKENNHPLPSLLKKQESSPPGLVLAETRKIRKHYLDEIIGYELGKTQSVYREEFLKRHRVAPDIRARMVNSKGRLDDRGALLLQLHAKHFLCRSGFHGRLLRTVRQSVRH